jgi:hypothetical protein
MNPYSDESVSGAMSNFEDTLRLISHVPVPEGLVDRVHAGLKTAPRRGRILNWPATPRPGSNWMRAAAAAAIVFVVAGGGWSVYSRVQPPPSAKVTGVPPHGAALGGFSNAGAMRIPQTVKGPMVTHAAAAAAMRQDTSPASKVSGQAAQTSRHSKPLARDKFAAQPAVPAAK